MSEATESLDTGRPDTGRPEVARPEVARPEVARLEAGRLEAARPDDGREDEGRPGSGRREYDAAGVERAIRDLLVAIGEDPERDGLRDTPSRVARSYAEVFAGLYADPADVLTTTFDLGHDEMVLVRDIEVYSTCEHHLVPFHGVAHVGYIPNENGRLTGLSKLARLVDVYARRPQVQERMTCQIADALMHHLEPRGVIVVLECEHLCMAMRGVRKPGSRTVTSAVRGLMTRQATRAEAMSLIVGR